MADKTRSSTKGFTNRVIVMAYPRFKMESIFIIVSSPRA